MHLNKDLERSGRTLFALCWLAYAVSYIGRLDFSSCMSMMVADGIFTTEFGGAVGTAFLACYGTGQLINGFAGDKVAPRTMIFIGLLGSGLMNVAMSFVGSASVAAVVWGMNGFFCSMLWAPVIRCFADYMTDKVRLSAGVNISSTIPIGTVCAYLISSVLLKTASWRTVFLVSGLAVAACAVVWLLGNLRLRPYLEEVSEMNRRSRSGVTADVKKAPFLPLLISSGVVFTVVAILFNGVLKDGITVWIPTYLKTTFDVSASFAAAVSIVLPLINIFGAYGANMLNRRVFRNEMTTSCVMFCISLSSILLLFFFGSVNIVLSAFLLALSTSSMLGANTMFLTFIPLQFGRQGRSSSMTGFLDACSYIASAVSSVIIGMTAVRYGWNVTVILWAAVAVVGGIVCIVGAPAWKKGKAALTDTDGGKR